MCTFFSTADQRNLGMSMKVERSTVDQVKQRFEMLKKKREEKNKDYDITERIQEVKEEVCRLSVSSGCFLVAYSLLC